MTKDADQFDLASIQRQLGAASLRDYVRMAWPEVEPGTTMLSNWHVDAVCEHLEAVMSGQITRLVINQPPGTMKPVWEAELVWTLRGRLPLRDVVVGDRVLTHKGRYRRVNAVHLQGALDCLVVETKDGRRVTAAPDHPFLTTEGWKQLQDITDRDTLAVVPARDVLSQGLTVEGARFLGYMTGDGSVKYGSKTFSQLEGDTLDEFERCAKALGFGVRRVKNANCRTIKATLTGGRPSILNAFLNLHGLNGKSSYTKRIPPSVLNGPPDILAHFLAAYLECDGFVGVRHTETKTSYQANYTTVSEGLAQDTQAALLRLGIRMRVRTRRRPLRTKKQPGGQYEFYVVTATSQDAIARLMELPIKGEKPGRVPLVRRRTFDSVLLPDPVVSVEPTGLRHCRCLSVEEDHSFTANDIVVHNSLTASVFFPTWSWTHSPETKWLTASYSDRVAARDAKRGRRLLESKWYQDRWSDVWQPIEGSWTDHDYRNSHAGFRFATTVAGSATGEHAHIQLVDDPLKPLDASHRRTDTNALIACIEWWDETMSSRVVDPITSRRVVLMQRLHDRDLSAHVLKTGGYEHLCLPMIAEKKCLIVVPHKCTMAMNAQDVDLPPTSVGFKDTREEDELLWPARFPAAVVENRKIEMAEAWSAQDQQRPSAKEGAIIKRDWIRTYTKLPEKIDARVMAWDMSFKKTKAGSYVVGQVWYRSKDSFYLVDQVRRRMGFSDTSEVFLAFCKKHSNVLNRLVEDKANGSAIIDALNRKVVGGIKEEPAAGSKESRLEAVSPIFRAGQVYLPDKSIAPWIVEYIEEIVNFPRAAHDDQVDTTSMALNNLAGARVIVTDIDFGGGGGLSKGDDFEAWRGDDEDF